MTDNTPAYMARWPCGHVNAVVVDMPEIRKDVSRHIANWIRAGAVIEHTTVEIARSELTMCYCDRKPRKKAAPKQETLL